MGNALFTVQGDLKATQDGRTVTITGITKFYGSYDLGDLYKFSLNIQTENSGETTISLIGTLTGVSLSTSTLIFSNVLGLRPGNLFIRSSTLNFSPVCHDIHKECMGDQLDFL